MPRNPGLLPPLPLRSRRLPGQPSAAQQVAAMIRVNHAGEYGAKRIYEGQLATIRDRQSRTIIREMHGQELPHLDYFAGELTRRRVRPTLLMPIWHVGGFVLGAVTAAMGKEVAMACTVAVESVIDEHYQEQEAQLDETEASLKENIAQFRAEEQEHHDTGLAEGAQQAIAYPLLVAAIRGITRSAIFLSQRI